VLVSEYLPVRGLESPRPAPAAAPAPAPQPPPAAAAPAAAGAAAAGLAGVTVRGGGAAALDAEMRRPLIGARSVVRILAGAGAGAG
jgi:hypothetical protein